MTIIISESKVSNIIELYLDNLFGDLERKTVSHRIYYGNNFIENNNSPTTVFHDKKNKKDIFKISEDGNLEIRPKSYFEIKGMFSFKDHEKLLDLILEWFNKKYSTEFNRLYFGSWNHSI